MSGQRPWVVGVLLGAAIFLCGLADTARSGMLGTARGADAPAYVRIATSLVEQGTPTMPGPGVLVALPQERLDDVFGSPWSMTIDGRLLPKHPVLFGAVLVPGIAIAGIPGARVTALLLGALLGGIVTTAATRRFGAASAALASLAVFVLSPAGRNVLWAINIDTMIAVLWFAAMVLADAGRPFPAGLLGGLLLFLRPPAILLLAGVAVVLAGRPRRDVRLFAAGLVPLLVVLAVVNTVWWGSPWASSYDRVAILSDAGLVLATHSSQFTLSPWRGLSILLFHGDGGLLATAPACLLGLLGLLLPERRDTLGVAATASATAFLLLLSGYTFLARVPETAYRFALPLLAASVLPLAALLRTAFDARIRHLRSGAAPGRSRPDGDHPPALAGEPLVPGHPGASSATVPRLPRRAPALRGTGARGESPPSSSR